LKGRLDGKTAIVVGASRGIGEGISRSLVQEGAKIALICSRTIDRARKIADEINQGAGTVIAKEIQADVTSERSVKNMVEKTLDYFGEIDVLIYSAGIVKSGSVKAMSLKDFETVTRVNYTGYFLCVKHVSRVMAKQHERDQTRIMDIIQINSKSGLRGSNRNSAYAGSKFGGIGLTQSFALELLQDGIKVNAICPGNYFDGSLWSNPKNGLFVQYLKSGKVPNAKTIEDVRRYYESKIPMRRGCTIEDIMHAVYYLIEQKYETGQTILVAGGQIMR
jgi:sorbitol-6-phosphate 2-dehydrogenase